VTSSQKCPWPDFGAGEAAAGQIPARRRLAGGGDGAQG